MPAERLIPATSRLLGHYLGCTPDDVDAALSRQSLPLDLDAPRRRRIGELLLEAGAVTMDGLLEGIQGQRIDRLRACVLFATLSDEELAGLSAVCQEVSVEAGTRFITQDAHDPCLYVLASGVCKVFRLDDVEQEVPLARVFPGEPVGEMGYFADGIRSASVRAIDDVQLLRASFDDLTDCFESVPGVAAAFMQVVTQRLRATNVLYQENPYQAPTGDRREEHLRDLVDMSRIAALEEGSDRLLTRMVHSASSLTDAERASLFLIDNETSELWSKVAQGPGVKEIRIPAGSGVAGWSIDNNELVNVEEAYDDERFNPEVDRRTGFTTHTILCAPVRSQAGRVIGAAQVINKQIGVFTDDDESLLRAFAAQAAVAVENLNLYREVVRDYRRLAVLVDVGTGICSAADASALTAEVSARVARNLDCERAQLLLLDGETGELWGVEEFNGERIERRYEPTGIIAGVSLMSGEVVNVPDVFEDVRFDPAIDDREGARTRSLLVVPLRDAEGDVRGTLQIMNRTNGVFEDDDVEILELITAQIGYAALLVGG